MQVEVGAALPEWVVEHVSDEKMKTMALVLRDPNPIHWDIDAVRDLGMGDRVVNQGPTNMGYVVNMLCEWLGDARRLKSLRVRFLDNVFGGDRVVVSGKVLDVRVEEGLRVADCEVWLDRSDGVRVLSGSATVSLAAD